MPFSIRAVKVGESKGQGLDAVNLVIDIVIFFGHTFIGRVDIERLFAVGFGNNVAMGLSNNSAAGGVNDTRGFIGFAYCLQYLQVSGTVDFLIEDRVGEGNGVGCLPRTIENDILMFHHIFHEGCISNIPLDKFYGRTHLPKAIQVAFKSWFKGIDHRHFVLAISKAAAHKVGSEESGPAQNQYIHGFCCLSKKNVMVRETPSSSET